MMHVSMDIKFQYMYYIYYFHITAADFPLIFQIFFHITIYCAVLKRLTTPSDFHIPFPSIVPFAHS